jgi:hypothetical protein
MTECGALAGVGRRPEHLGARGLGSGCGLVARTVVDDDDWQVPPRALDDGPDPGALLIGRDECVDRAGWLGHPGSIAPDVQLS